MTRLSINNPAAIAVIVALIVLFGLISVRSLLALLPGAQLYHATEHLLLSLRQGLPDRRHGLQLRQVGRSPVQPQSAHARPDRAAADQHRLGPGLYRKRPRDGH